MTEIQIVRNSLRETFGSYPQLIDQLDLFPDDFICNVISYSGELRWLSTLIVLIFARAYKAKNIIETGTLRRTDSPDGQSTKVFAEYVKLYGGKFYSVDISTEAISISKSEVGPTLLPYVNYVCEDSVGWLSRFNEQIDVLYLDSYDFDDKNPDPSQQHELAEIGAAFGKLNNPAVIALDDCDIPFEGKSRLGSQFLRDRGWKLLFDGYQRVFINP